MNCQSFFKKVLFLLFFIIIIYPTAECLANTELSEHDTTKGFFDQANNKFNNMFNKTVETADSSIDKPFEKETNEDTAAEATDSEKIN
jgi:hypothetical protein